MSLRVIMAVGVVALRLSAQALPDILYPPLPLQARVDGDVHLRMTNTGPHVLAGHPLLAPAAREHFKLLKIAAGNEAIYRFVIVPRPDIELEVKRGTALSRLFHRLGGRKTVRMETRQACYDEVPVPSELDRPWPPKIERGEPITLVWVYAYSVCVNTQFAMLDVARRAQ